MNKTVYCFFTAIIFLALMLPGTHAQNGPKPGDIYREYMKPLRENNYWRVTDPDARHPGAQDFLPNPVMTLEIDDLEGAARAELQMDIWGGHAGTTEKRFRFNDNPWIDVPDVPTIEMNPECYMTQYNVIMDIPLDYLLEGENTFEGNSGGQSCYDFGWGQWGWYVMIVRIYYEEGKDHVEGYISNLSTGSAIADNPVIEVSVADDDAVDEIQLLSKYYGYDVDGDGYYREWHHAYHVDRIENHAGTATSAPWNITWDTRWVPDQEPAGISLMARIKNKNGIWFVAPVVQDISLERPENISVIMYTPYNVAEKFTVRAGKKMSCNVSIDNLENAVEARLFHRTWNGSDTHGSRGHIMEPLKVNGYGFKCNGENHYYALSGVDIPVKSLVQGEMEISYTSDTEHHGIEILWPGPAIIIRYDEHKH